MQRTATKNDKGMYSRDERTKSQEQLLFRINLNESGTRKKRIMVANPKGQDKDEGEEGKSGESWPRRVQDATHQGKKE